MAVSTTRTSYFCEDENVWKASTIPQCGSQDTSHVSAIVIGQRQGGRQDTSAIVIRDSLYNVGAGRSFCQYDPCTNKWFSLPLLLTNHKNLATAFHDDYLYVFDTTKCAERYNFTSRKWQYISCLPFTFAQTPSAVAYSDKLIVVGITEVGKMNKMKMVSFDPQTNSWTKIGTMTRKGVQNVQLVVVEQNLYSVQTGRKQDETGWFPNAVVTRHKPPVHENEDVESTTEELKEIESGSDSSESCEEDVQFDVQSHQCLCRAQNLVTHTRVRCPGRSSRVQPIVGRSIHVYNALYSVLCEND